MSMANETALNTGTVPAPGHNVNPHDTGFSVAEVDAIGKEAVTEMREAAVKQEAVTQKFAWAIMLHMEGLLSLDVADANYPKFDDLARDRKEKDFGPFKRKVLEHFIGKNPGKPKDNERNSQALLAWENYQSDYARAVKGLEFACDAAAAGITWHMFNRATGRFEVPKTILLEDGERYIDDMDHDDDDTVPCVPEIIALDTFGYPAKSFQNYPTVRASMSRIEWLARVKHGKEKSARQIAQEQRKQRAARMAGSGNGGDDGDSAT